MPFPEEWRGVADLLRTTSGGVFRNVVAQAGVTCGVCRTPVAGFPRCIQCERHRNSGLPLADRVGLLTYAVKGLQAYQVMYNYKLADSADRLRDLVQLMLGLGTIVHSRCLSVIAGRPVDRWAVVPSTRVQPDRHALRLLVAQMASLPPELRLGVGTVRSRVLDPRSFLPAERLVGEHVLVIDDSWVSGAYAQSAAVALKQAGAGQVSVFAPARVLDPAGWQPTKTYLAQHPAEDFDPTRCPWTFGACP